MRARSKQNLGRRDYAVDRKRTKPDPAYDNMSRSLMDNTPVPPMTRKDKMKAARNALAYGERHSRADSEIRELLAYLVAPTGPGSVARRRERARKTR